MLHPYLVHKVEILRGVPPRAAVMHPVRYSFFADKHISGPQVQRGYEGFCILVSCGRRKN